MIPPHTNRYPKPPSGAATGWGRFFVFQIRGSGRRREVRQSPSGLASSASSPLRGAPFARAKPARGASPHRGGGRAAAMAGGAFAVRGGRPRGKRYMGGNGKVEGRACPAPTGCHKWVADERGKGGRQPAPLQWAGGRPGTGGDVRPVGIPQSPNGDSPSGPDPSVAPRHLPTLWGVTL